MRSAAPNANPSSSRVAQSLRTATVILSIAFCSLRGHATVTFQGYVVTANRPMFVIATEKEGSSRWLTIGQHFDGFSIVTFDENAEQLTVEKEGKRHMLRLVEAKVQPAKSTASGEPKRSILVSFGGGEAISIGDDEAALQALKNRLAIIATTMPKPTVTIHYPRDEPARQMVPVIDLIRAAGITGLSIRTH